MEIKDTGYLSPEQIESYKAYGRTTTTMENEFGENPKFYIFPVDNEEGTAYPEDFHERLTKALTSVGLDWEAV